MFTKKTLINELNNKTKTQIANECNISRKKLLNIEKSLGITKEDYEPVYQNKEKMLNLLDLHGTPSKVAIAIGVNKTTISQWYNRHGLTEEFRRTHKLNEDYFKDIDSENKAYWLGYLMADGSMDRTCTKLTFNISSIDEEMLTKFLFDIGSSTTIKHSINNGFSYSRVLISSQRFCKDLIYHGIVPKKSGKEILPDTIPNYLIKHFIRGYLDGDGSIITYDKCKSAIRLDFAGMSYNIFYSIHDFFIKESVVDSDIIIKRENNSRCLHLNYHSNNAIKVLKYLYEDCNICLERKYKRFKNKISPLL